MGYKILKKQPTIKELNITMKKLRAKGYKPYLKGKGSGRIKLEFE